MDEQEPPHWEGEGAVEQLQRLLNLHPEYALEQDWQYICSDFDRLTEFFDLYENGNLDVNGKHALMKLIVASFPIWRAPEKPIGRLEQQHNERVERLLRQDFLIHLHTIRYWCFVDVEKIDDDLENVYSVTPLMRRIWSDCFKPEHQKWMKEYE